MKKRQEEDLSRKQLLLTLKGKENVTLDGQKVMLYANIGNIKDLATVIQNDELRRLLHWLPRLLSRPYRKVPGAV